MEDAARHGRTVLFVSHNLGAVRNLCRSVLVIEGGRQQFQGPVEEGVALYESRVSNALDSIANRHFPRPLSDRLRFEEIVSRQGGEVVAVVDPLRETTIEVRGAALGTFPTLELSIGVFRDGVHGGLLSRCAARIEHEGRRLPLPFPHSVRRLEAGPKRAGPRGGGGQWRLDLGIRPRDARRGGEVADDSAARDRGLVGLRYTAERVQ